MKVITENKNKIIILLVIFGILILFLNNSYAFENRLDNIPDISTLTKDDLDLPSSFDLRNVNGVNYMTPIKDQGHYGLCWAFSATTAFESILKRSGYVDNSFNEWFSPFQVDALVTKDVKTPNINYVTDDRNRKLGDGDYTETNYAYKAFTTAYSPVLMNTFDETKYKDKYNLNYNFYAEDVYNEKNSNYYVTDYDILTKINDIPVIDVVKYYIYNYGGVTVNTFSPHVYCQNYHEPCYIKSITYSKSGGHAMTIIGWDDNENSWILQNSWGDNLPYIYLSYDSKINDYLAIKNISTTNSWDNRYYPSSTQRSAQYYSYYKTPNNEEVINSIVVDVKKPGNYKIFLSTDWDENYELISSFKADFVGRKTIKLLDKNLLIGNSVQDKIFIKIYDVDTNTITDRYSIGEDVYMFTNDVTNNNDEKIHIYDVNDLTSNFQTFSIKFKAFNLDKSNLNFKIKNNLGEDVTNKFVLKDTYFSNNYGQWDYDVKLEDTNGSAEYTIEALYNNNVLSSKTFNVLNFQSLSFKIGDGTEDNPFIITTSIQLQSITTDARYLKYSYKLGCDIDMSNTNFSPIGDDNHPFTGSFDGNNYTIKNLKFNEDEQFQYTGLFGTIRNATIKNVKLKNANINFAYSDRYNGSGGVLVGTANASIIDNIYIDGGNLNILQRGYYASIVGMSYATIISNVYSSISITINFSKDNVFVGGLIGGGSNFNNSIQKNSLINSEFAGNINIVDKNYSSEIGGIIGGQFDAFAINNVIVSATIINNNSNKYVGYFVGHIKSNDISHITNSLYYRKTEQINIIGNNSGNVIDNIEEYNNIYAITETNINSSIKYIDKNSDRFLDKNTYNLDFNNSWIMTDNGPKLRSLTIDLIDKTNYIGETDVYDVDYEKGIISNVKFNNNESTNITLTRKEFISDFIAFTGDIYTTEGSLITTDDSTIGSGMIVRKNNKEYKIAINGDVNGDARINTADIITLRRYIVGGYNIKLEDYQLKAADVNKDGMINSADVIIIRRAIAGGYKKECQYVWRNC